MQYDVVIPYHVKDSKVIGECVRSCKEYMEGVRNIYIVTNDDFEFPGVQGVYVAKQDDFFEEKPTIQYIKDCWEKVNKDLSHRAGWMFQQFVKMGACYSIKGLTEKYIVMDADVVLLNPMNLVNNAGKMRLFEGVVVHKPYIECYEKLVGLDPILPSRSYVSHMMMFDKKIMQELLDHIEKKHSRPWYDAVLDNMNMFEPSPFSEFQSYGEYVFSKHPDLYVMDVAGELGLDEYTKDFTSYAGKADYLLFSSFLIAKKKKKKMSNLFRIRFWKKLLLDLIKK